MRNKSNWFLWSPVDERTFFFFLLFMFKAWKTDRNTTASSDLPFSRLLADVLCSRHYALPHRAYVGIELSVAFMLLLFLFHLTLIWSSIISMFNSLAHDISTILFQLNNSIECILLFTSSALIVYILSLFYFSLAAIVFMHWNWLDELGVGNKILLFVKIQKKDNKGNNNNKADK